MCVYELLGFTASRFHRPQRLDGFQRKRRRLLRLCRRNGSLDAILRTQIHSHKKLMRAFNQSNGSPLLFLSFFACGRKKVKRHNRRAAVPSVLLRRKRALARKILYFFKSFCLKRKVFSKNPLKNVRKYNIMIAIIGLFVKTPRKKRKRERFPFWFLHPIHR